MLPINDIICGRNEDVLATFPDASIDLTVTSPPYDNLRTYKGFEWNFDATAQQLHRVTKHGGVVVWVVADATINGSETGTSFRQALRFMEIGFKLHDTMIYERKNKPLTHNRYEQEFEYMFVFGKGKPQAFNAITIPCVQRKMETYQRLDRGGGSVVNKNYRMSGETRIKGNVWRYAVGRSHTGDDLAFEHDAPYPEKLAEDHILSWSNPGDIVLDPFIGSGTTAKMAIRHDRRYIGIDSSEEYCELARNRINQVQRSMVFV